MSFSFCVCVCVFGQLPVNVMELPTFFVHSLKSLQTRFVDLVLLELTEVSWFTFSFLLFFLFFEEKDARRRKEQMTKSEIERRLQRALLCRESKDGLIMYPYNAGDWLGSARQLVAVGSSPCHSDLLSRGRLKDIAWECKGDGLSTFEF